MHTPDAATKARGSCPQPYGCGRLLLVSYVTGILRKQSRHSSPLSHTLSEEKLLIKKIFKYSFEKHNNENMDKYATEQNIFTAKKFFYSFEMAVNSPGYIM